MIFLTSLPGAFRDFRRRKSSPEMHPDFRDLVVAHRQIPSAYQANGRTKASSIRRFHWRFEARREPSLCERRLASEPVQHIALNTTWPTQLTLRFKTTIFAQSSVAFPVLMDSTSKVIAPRKRAPGGGQEGQQNSTLQSRPGSRRVLRRKAEALFVEWKEPLGEATILHRTVTSLLRRAEHPPKSSR